MTVSDPGLILPESACRWPQVFHTQAIRLRPMSLFNPVFNCLTPIVIKRSKTQADEGLTPADEAGSVVLRQPPASKLANLFRIDVRDHALGLVTQQLGGRVTEHPPAGWLGPRTPSLREGPGSASVPSGSPDPVAGTGARVLAGTLGANHVSRAPQSGWSPTGVGKKSASGRTKLKDLSKHLPCVHSSDSIHLRFGGIVRVLLIVREAHRPSGSWLPQSSPRRAGRA